MSLIITTKDGEDVTTALHLTAVWEANGHCSAFLVKEGKKVLGCITMKRLAEELRKVGAELR